MVARLCDHVIVLAEGRRLAEGSFSASCRPIRPCRRPTWDVGGRHLVTGVVDGRASGVQYDEPLVASGVVAGYGAQDEILKGVDLVVRRGRDRRASSAPMVRASRRCSRPSPACCGPKPAAIALDGADFTGLPPREISRLGRRLRAAGVQHLSRPCRCARTWRSAATSIRKAAARRIDGVLARFPVLADKRRHAARTRSPAASGRCWPWRWR